MTNANITKKKPIYSAIKCDCGVTFQPKTSRQKHCSPECRFRSIAEQFKDVDGCWEWPKGYFSQTGYGQFAIDAKTPETAHRMSYQVFTGKIGIGMFVCHKCDNRKCFNPNHLFLGTCQDNVDDMYSKGRQAKNIQRLTGKDNPRVAMPHLYEHLKKFTQEQEHEILLACKSKSLREVSRLFNCSHSTIRRVLKDAGLGR